MHRTTSVSECMNPHVYPQAYKHELFFQIKPHRRNLNSSYSTQVFLHLYQCTSRTKNSQKFHKIPITKVSVNYIKVTRTKVVQATYI
jgi:hypothetical protein